MIEEELSLEQAARRVRVGPPLEPGVARPATRRAAEPAKYERATLRWHRRLVSEASLLRVSRHAIELGLRALKREQLSGSAYSRSRGESASVAAPRLHPAAESHPVF
jgi:hypothetical protein